MKDIKAPFYGYSKLKGIAKDFLDKYHTSKALPIPIEEIIEFHFGINIVPIPGLQRILEVDAFLSQDLTTISVDESVYEGRINRYRFSLAHELAHVILHQDIYKQAGSDSISEWKASMGQFPPKEYFFLEWQADNLAGLMLVPPEQLAQNFQSIYQNYSSNGVEDDVRKFSIAMELAEIFLVSSKVVQIRIEKDGLLK